MFFTFSLGNLLRATTGCTFSTSGRPKVVRACGAFNIFTWKCASRHNGLHFFDISTSKSGPNMVWFVHFDLKMCFAPQRRALFRHLNFSPLTLPTSAFPSVHIVGGLTSKLPSVMINTIPRDVVGAVLSRDRSFHTQGALQKQTLQRAGNVFRTVSRKIFKNQSVPRPGFLGT